MFKKSEQNSHDPTTARRSNICYPDAPKGLTWTCHVCSDERPDRFISVFSREVQMEMGICARVNIRYCNDRPECMAGAPSVTMGGL